MRAVVIRETGGPEQLEPAEMPEPCIFWGRCLVRVRAARGGVLDLLVRSGNYPQTPPLPVVPGVEIAGEVDGRGVMGMGAGSGGYAEAAGMEDADCIRFPEGASFEEGASFLLTFLTAASVILAGSAFGSDTTVPLHAGAGGVGCAANPGRSVPRRAVHHNPPNSEEKHGFAPCEQGAEEAYGYDEFAEHVRPDVVVDPINSTGPRKVLTTLISSVR